MYIDSFSKVGLGAFFPRAAPNPLFPDLFAVFFVLSLIFQLSMELLTKCFRPSAPDQLPIGKAADGRQVFAPFRPSVLQQAQLMNPFLGEKATVADAIPFPPGISMAKCKANGQLQVFLSPPYAGRMRKVYGYIGEIKLVRG